MGAMCPSSHYSAWHLILRYCRLAPKDTSKFDTVSKQLQHAGQIART